MKNNTMRSLSIFSMMLLMTASLALAGGKPQVGGDDKVTGGTLPPPVTIQSLPAVGGTWVAQGGAPNQAGQVEGMAGSPVSGAVDVIVAHPSNADIAWVGAINGGIWKTTNATNASPAWTPQSDAAASLSITALKLDPTDATNNTLVAGTGAESSFGENGPMGVMLRTTNGGTNWTQLTAALLANKSVTNVAPRGATIVASVSFANPYTCTNIGIFRSTDTGATFTRISGGGGTGLPNGVAWDLAGDPTNNAVLYTAISYCGTVAGIYKSTDTGATWAKVSDAAIDALLAENANPGNVKISVGAAGQVYVAIVDNGELAGLFRSGNGGTSWTQLDTPVTIENGSPIGIHPSRGPGGQGGVHFSLAADLTDANIVYIGGDRQPLGIDGASFPNSIGAVNYTGRLFRVNAGAAPGSQSTPLTHCQTANAACNGAQSTTNNSSPHADSRALALDASGNLLEGDDGGIYRRTSPKATGAWVSVNGNLQITEMHDIVYDRVSNMIVSGNQDTGTTEQTTEGGTVWTTVSQGDGGDVSCDDLSSATQSMRYTSFQGLGGFQRRTIDTSGTTTSNTFPDLTVLGGGDFLSPQFVTPVELNRIDPTRILFAGSNDLYESLDRGDTMTALEANFDARAMVYGGRASGVDNLDLIYAISGTLVYVRTSGSGAPVLTTTQPGTNVLRDIAVDPSDWNKAYVVNEVGQVWSTVNHGGTWTNITGNLGSGSTDLWTIVFVSGNPNLVVVGGGNGVFRMATNNSGVWNQLGTGLSNAFVRDLDYDEFEDVLVAGVMGRGAWKLTPIANFTPLPSLTINDVTVTEGNAGTTNAVFTVSLSPAVPWHASVSYATADGTTSSGTPTPFTNSSSISIPNGGNATPYPSNITVSGLTGVVTKVTVTLNNFNHTWNNDVDVLLVGPGGQSCVLMSDVGGSGISSGITITLDDSAANFLPSSTSLSSGTYKPTNIADGLGFDDYSSPAPVGPYGATLSAFNGTAPNGTWSLYVVDDASPDSGSFAGGWTVSVSTGGDIGHTSGTLVFEPNATSKTITVPVYGDTTVESNETYFVNLSSAANAIISDSQGQGTITNDDGGLLPPTNVVATAAAATTINITWNAAAGASTYRVYRNSGGGFAFLGELPGTGLSDATVSANTAYLYKVRSFNGSESPDSNIDLATTVMFTDPTLTVGSTPVKLVHFNELLTAVNAVRTLASQGTISFTGPAPTTNVTVRRQHVLDLRSGLDAARAILALSAVTYTDPTITAGTTLIQAAHINDLRNGVK